MPLPWFAYGLTIRRFQPTSPGWAAVARAVTGAVVITTAAMLTSVAGRAGEAVQAVTPLTVGVAVAGSVLAVGGAGALALTRHGDVALLSAAASMLMVVAVASLFSVGVLVLPFAVVTLVLLGRRLSERRGLAVALLAGPAVAVGLVVLFVIWVQPPLVECHQHGASGSTRPWWRTGSGAGTGAGADSAAVSASSPAVTTGSIETPSGRYVYRCEGGKLTEFRRA